MIEHDHDQDEWTMTPALADALEEFKATPIAVRCSTPTGAEMQCGVVSALFWVHLLEREIKSTMVWMRMGNPDLLPARTRATIEAFTARHTALQRGSLT